MLRKNLREDVLYYDTISEQYFYTTNAPGVIWITLEEREDMFDDKAIFVDLEEI